MSNYDRAKLAYSIFRGGLRNPGDVPHWDDAPPWVRDVVIVGYLQGLLDAPALEPLALADRIDSVPIYTAAKLGMRPCRQCGTPAGSGSLDARVFLVGEGSRKLIVKALRSLARDGSQENDDG